MKHDKPWRQMYSGRRVDPVNVKTEDIHIIDIAHHLANQGRYGGSMRGFESVAEHSVLMARYCMEQVQYRYREGVWNISATQLAKHMLMHDAPEAYVQDINRPLKLQLLVRDSKGKLITFKELEKRISAVINPVFGLSAMCPPLVDDYDDRITRTEGHAGMLHDSMWQVRQDGLPVKIMFWTPEQAEREFLQTYNELWGRE